MLDGAFQQVNMKRLLFILHSQKLSIENIYYTMHKNIKTVILTYTTLPTLRYIKNTIEYYNSYIRLFLRI